MKKSILLLVAAAACVIFTACPDKSDEVVVIIPDGLYEETAHFVKYTVYVYGDEREEMLAIDTVFTTQVLIDQGEFIYQDMCADTIHVGTNAVRYHNSPFIYSANVYCPEINREGEILVNPTITSPARMSSDGFVVIPAPQFSDSWYAWYQVDDNYVYRAPVSENGNVFYFEQNHEFADISNIVVRYRYHIEHTLRRL